MGGTAMIESTTGRALGKHAPAERYRVHSVAFEDPDQALHAVKTFRDAEFEVANVYTPFAVHGMEEALGLPETNLPWATFWGGVAGLTVGLGFQFWAHAIDWPLNIGGKTSIAWPASLPVAFEMTVLLSAIATVGALLVTRGLRPRRSAATPDSQPDPRATDDRFVLLVVERDGGFLRPRFDALCTELGAVDVVEGWRVL